MALRQVVLLTDDLTGEEIKQGEGETVTFSIDRTDYEIDLSTANAGKLRDELAPFVSAARKASGDGRRRRVGGRQTRDYDIAAVRAWARSNNVDIPSRGRIPQAIIDRYKVDMGEASI
jgi:hypothetical protein